MDSVEIQRRKKDNGYRIILLFGKIEANTHPIFMWQCIDGMDVPKDYLQIFKCGMSDTKQKFEHMQEEKREHLFLADTPVFCKLLNLR